MNRLIFSTGNETMRDVFYDRFRDIYSDWLLTVAKHHIFRPHIEDIREITKRKRR